MKAANEPRELLQFRIPHSALQIGKWGLWSDSHRRIRVYETRPVAAKAQRQNGVHGRGCTCGLHLRTVAL
jgi:hypothetical protein